MNLKEAFRMQNKLLALINEAQSILSVPSNVTEVKTTSLYKKVSPELENETVIEAATTDYSENITDIARFIIWLLGEREMRCPWTLTARPALIQSARALPIPSPP